MRRVVSRRFWQAFKTHRSNARARNIKFEFTYDEWLKIWLASGHLHERGTRSGQYVMARIGDKGPYAADNVKIITHIENSREANLGNQYGLGNQNAKGLKHSEKTKAIIAEKNRNGGGHSGHKHSEETKLELARKRREWWLNSSDEKITQTKARMGASKIGNKNAARKTKQEEVST